MEKRISIKKREVKEMKDLMKLGIASVLVMVADFSTKNAKRIIGKVEKEMKKEEIPLNKQLQARIQQIKETNSRNLIYNKYIPEVIKETLERDNMLISEQNAFHQACRKYSEDFAKGKIDELCRYVGEVRKVKGEQ